MWSFRVQKAVATGARRYSRDMRPRADASSADAATERRESADRRRQRTPMVSSYLIRGRRRGGRRDGERERIYVDRPGGWVIAAFAAILLLSSVDAYLTLRMVADGGEEANPVMRFVLSLGEGSFVVVKTGLTLVGLALLSLHKTWPLGRACLWLAFGGYALVTAIHIWGLLQRG
jgi:hypothetical protein